MTPEERLEHIARYAGGLEAVQIALLHIGEHGLDEAPDGEWTPRQIVHHLADAELFRSVRLRQLLAADDAQLPSFEQEHFAVRLDYSRPIQGSIELLRAMMNANMELLRGLSEDAWKRAGHHPVRGLYSMEDWLKAAADHGIEHAAQLQVNAAWHEAGVHSTS